MKRPLLVGVLAGALLLAGCASDDTSGGSGAGSDPSAATVDLAGSVTVDDMGRLVPAACSGSNAASEADGVTEDAVNVAALSIDFAALAQVGFTFTDLDPTATFATFVDAVNEDGGVCGRSIDVQQVVYDIIQGEGGQACVEATEDRTNLAVNTAGYDEILCISDAGVPAFTGTDLTESDLEQANGLLFTRFPTLDDQYRATVQYALDQGALEGKVGVWYGNLFPNQGDAAEEVVLPMLDDAGVDYVAYRTDSAGPTDPEGNAILTSAATDFVSQDIDTLLMFVGNTNHTGMQTELAAQGLHPRFISAPIAGNSSNETFAEQFGTREIADGQEFVTSTLGVSEIGPDDPTAASCAETWEAQTGEAVEPFTFDYSLVVQTCVQVDVLAAALSLAGGDLTRERFTAALESLPAYRVPPLLGEVAWTADDHAGPATFSVQDYDGATNTVSTREERFEPGG